MKPDVVVYDDSFFYRVFGIFYKKEPKDVREYRCKLLKIFLLWIPLILGLIIFPSVCFIAQFLSDIFFNANFNITDDVFSLFYAWGKIIVVLSIELIALLIVIVGLWSVRDSETYQSLRHPSKEKQRARIIIKKREEKN